MRRMTTQLSTEVHASNNRFPYMFLSLSLFHAQFSNCFPLQRNERTTYNIARECYRAMAQGCFTYIYIQFCKLLCKFFHDHRTYILLFNSQILLLFYPHPAYLYASALGIGIPLKYSWSSHCGDGTHRTRYNIEYSSSSSSWHRESPTHFSLSLFLLFHCVCVRVVYT